MSEAGKHQESAARRGGHPPPEPSSGTPVPPPKPKRSTAQPLTLGRVVHAWLGGEWRAVIIVDDRGPGDASGYVVPMRQASSGYVWVALAPEGEWVLMADPPVVVTGPHPWRWPPRV